MYFCPQCSYLFDISKSSQVAKTADVRTQLDKVQDLLKKIEEGVDLSEYKAGFSSDELAKNKKYQKLSDQDKMKLSQLFQETTSSGAEFKCKNCNFSREINETTLLYQINMVDKIVKTKTHEENQLICNDPTLPHTHDYTCKNPSCITHKSSNLKDAIFYKDKGSFKPIYICGVCYYSW